MVPVTAVSAVSVVVSMVRGVLVGMGPRRLRHLTNHLTPPPSARAYTLEGYLGNTHSRPMIHDRIHRRNDGQGPGRTRRTRRLSWTTIVVDLYPFLATPALGTLRVVPDPDGSSGGTPARVEDRQLAARLMGGDQTALAEIYDRYAALVFALARRLLQDESMAEDVTQEVFVYLWDQPQRFDPAKGSLRAWLALLAHHRSVDRVRREERRARSEARSPAVEPAPAGQAAVDDQLAMDWMAGRVRDALDQLPAEQREAIVLAYFGGRTYRQVAAELAIPEGTAKSRLRLALAKLNELLRTSLTDQDEPAWT